MIVEMLIIVVISELLPETSTYSDRYQCLLLTELLNDNMIQYLELITAYSNSNLVPRIF